MPQVTTEAVGRYTPHEMRELVRELRPGHVSIAPREMFSGGVATPEDVAFYRWMADEGIAVQHICYNAGELDGVVDLLARPGLDEPPRLLFALGHYERGPASHPGLLEPYLAALAAHRLAADWAACAFGVPETACLEAVLRAGGKVRVGFENSIFHADGSIAADNAERVAAVARLADRIAPPDGEQAAAAF